MSVLIQRPALSLEPALAARVSVIATPAEARGAVYVDLGGETSVDAFFRQSASHQHRAQWAFEAFVAPELCAAMRRDFPGERKLIVRGVTLNTGKPFSFRHRNTDVALKSLAEVLATGSELGASPYQPNGSGIVTEVLAMDPEEGVVPSYVLSYLWIGVLDYRKAAPAELGPSLFPGIIVYDESLGQSSPERPCGWLLPADVESASRAIRRIYLFDFYG